TTTMDLIVLPVPVDVEPTPLEACDVDDNGIAEFDLTQKDSEITGGASGLIVRYFTSQRRAELGDPADEILNGIYTNSRSPYNDTVWARVENAQSGCFDVVALELIVNPLPDKPVAGFGDLFSCDPDGGSTAIFDLTLNTPFVYGDQSPDDFSISYHTSLEDATLGVNAIVNPESFESSGQTIWVRLEAHDTGCARISSFELIVGEMPVIVEPEDMVLCDDEESGSNTDGISIFNLSSNDHTITGGNGNWQVFYYETLEDQQNHNPIANPSAYANPVDADGRGISPYTIYISVFNREGCAATTTMDLIVLPVPVVVEPTPLEACDVDDNGIAEFDLTRKDSEITGGASGLIVRYFTSQRRARIGDPADEILNGIYTNSRSPYNDTVWARVENAQSGCFDVVALELIV